VSVKQPRWKISSFKKKSSTSIMSASPNVLCKLLDPANGLFELTQSLAKYTRANILTEGGVKTEVFTRFSTVAGGAGSIDTPRDVRGRDR
jgi:hypothetical protein